MPARAWDVENKGVWSGVDTAPGGFVVDAGRADRNDRGGCFVNHDDPGDSGACDGSGDSDGSDGGDAMNEPSRDSGEDCTALRSSCSLGCRIGWR